MTRDEHIDGAERFLRFADSLAQQQGDATAVGWALTALFYAALHGLRAYFVTQGYQADSHEAAKRLCLADHRTRVLRPDYEHLKQTSEKARYYLDTQATWDDYTKVRQKAVKVLKSCFSLMKHHGFNTAPP